MPKKKQGKPTLPKTIAGVRISKELRKAVEPVLRFAGQPGVSDALAAGLVAGADALIAGKKGRAVSGAAVGAAVTGLKKHGSVGLMLAIAAGEIASHIVAAYGAAPDADRPTGKERRSGSSGRK